MSSQVELKELGSLFLGFGGLVYVSCNCLQDFGPLAGRLKKFPNFQTPDSDSVTFFLVKFRVETPTVELKSFAPFFLFWGVGIYVL